MKDRRYSRSSRSKLQGRGLWGKETLVIERMSQEGRGVATRHGKVVFVSDALIGEQVRVQCTAVKRDYDEADLLELLDDSAPCAMRVQPECPVYQQCGGCSLQHWSLDAQREHKQANLLAMLQAIAPVQLDPPIISRSSGFRHRLRVVVTRTADRGYALGLRRRRSHQTVNVQHCLVANAAVNSLLQTLPVLLLTVPDLQGLREIEIDGDSRDQLGLCFYFAAHPGEKVLSALRDSVLRNPVVALRVRLYASGRSRGDSPYNEGDAGELVTWKELLAEGELHLLIDAPKNHSDAGDPGLEMAYLPGDFTQTHWEVNAALVARTLDWLQPENDELALDLFCGIGNFSLPLARSTRTVHALEGDSNMTRRVVANAQRNGIENIRVSTLNLMAQELVLPKADIAVVDPPRAGAKAVCEALALSKVRRLVYVSCHPATLQRDARILHGAGFRLRRAAVVDMFAHTGHSEAIALFEKKRAATPQRRVQPGPSTRQ